MKETCPNSSNVGADTKSLWSPEDLSRVSEFRCTINNFNLHPLSSRPNLRIICRWTTCLTFVLLAKISRFSKVISIRYFYNHPSVWCPHEQTKCTLDCQITAKSLILHNCEYSHLTFPVSNPSRIPSFASSIKMHLSEQTRCPSRIHVWARRNEPTQIVSKGQILGFVSWKNLILCSPGNNVESIFGRRIGICVHWLSSVRMTVAFRVRTKNLSVIFDVVN